MCGHRGTTQEELVAVERAAVETCFKALRLLVQVRSCPQKQKPCADPCFFPSLGSIPLRRSTANVCAGQRASGRELRSRPTGLRPIRVFTVLLFTSLGVVPSKLIMHLLFNRRENLAVFCCVKLTPCNAWHGTHGTVVGRRGCKHTHSERGGKPPFSCSNVEIFRWPEKKKTGSVQKKRLRREVGPAIHPFGSYTTPACMDGLQTQTQHHTHSITQHVQQGPSQCCP